MDLEHTMDATAGATGVRRVADEPGGLERGATVGRFVLLGTLGAGGMGVVYAAYDPELDRKVALKLLLPRADGSSVSAGPARLMREAQALAKLSHPNVVAVHDVGTHADSVWIAMEFVEGQTLTAWAQARPRRWSEALPVLADVARGVAAAHMARLVHRDLKPDNVMIGRDGRVRVMDFGLAHGRSPAATEPKPAPASVPLVGTTMQPALAATLVLGAQAQPEHAALASRLTAVGAVQGTPAYMAPEQWQGQEAEPATDQFGWSVMAWELLYGERPFAGETMMNLAAAVLAGQRKPPPRGLGVPGWLRRVIERGLAIEPARRWPTMAALLAALERGKTRARIRTAVVALSGITLFGAGAEGYRRWDVARRMDVCAAAGADIDRVWNDDVRKPLRVAFMATGVSYAETTADKVMPWLDEQARAWKQARTDVCLNADVRAVWGEDLLDRAMWCLEDRQMDLASLVAELGRANATTVQQAVLAAAKLRAVDACLNEGMLERQPAPPVQGRAAIRDVRARLSRAQSLGLAGDPKEALALAVQAREQAAAVHDWPPLLAAARAQEGILLGAMGAYEDAEAASREAYFEAARSGAWEVAAEAASALVFLVGYHRARHGDGRTWAQHAEVALVYAGDRAGLAEARRLNNLAVVHEATGAYAEAQALHERALAIREQALGQGHPEVAVSLVNLADVHKEIGAYAEARTLYERALAIQEQALGQGHPAVALTLNNLANVLEGTGDRAEARTLYERALAIQEKTLGPGHPAVALTLNNLAAVHQSTGAYVEARALYERSLAIREQVLGPGHPDVADSLNNLANVHQATGAYAEARAMHERALAIREQVLGSGHTDVADSLNNLAITHQATGAYAEARALNERALAIQEKALGPDHPDIALTLNNLASVYRATGANAEALRLHERALAIQEKALGHDHPDIATMLNNLANVHAATGAYAEALALTERALTIQKKALGQDHPYVAHSLNTLGLIHAARGEYVEARAQHERALAIREQALGQGHPDVASSLNNLADVHLLEQQPQEALPLLERALVILDTYEGVQSAEFHAHFNLARALIATDGDRARALALARKAREGFREIGEARLLAELEQFLADLDRR